MARPTKEEKAKKEALKETGIFRRDNPIYTDFEEVVRVRNLKRLDKIYIFCTLCENRKDRDTNEIRIKHFIEKNDEVFLKLNPIDSEIAYFMACMANYSYTSLEDDAYFSYQGPYKTQNLMPSRAVIQAFGGIEKLKKFLEGVQSDAEYYLLNAQIISFEDVVYMLERDGYKEKANIFKEKIFEEVRNMNDHPLLGEISYCTVVNSVNRYLYSMIGLMGEEHKKLYIEIDPTKPLSDIIDQVTEIKKAYDENPENFKSLYEHLSDSIKPHKCDLDNCDILKKGSGGTAKPLEGVMADMLFIYDCLFAGLDNKHIIKEINRYWQKVLNISEDTMSESTYRRYKREIIKLIDEGKYNTLLTGYEINPQEND